MLYLILSSEVDIIDLEKGEFKYSPLLKIGYTKDIDSRFDSYELHNPGCKLIGTREGTTELESYFHSYYSKYKYPKRDEWFYYSQEIVDNFQTLEIGDKYLTKREYIEGLKEYLRSNISTPQELKNKYLDNLLNELESMGIGSEVEFDREFHKSFTLSIWDEEYGKKLNFLESFDFQSLLRNFPEEINLRENPWKNTATFYYRSTADYRKMDWEDFKKIINKKEEDTENLLQAYNEVRDSAVKYSLAKNYQYVAKNANYKENYVAVNRIVNDQTGDVILKPVMNELVRVNELRAFKIQQIDYQDRFTVFTTIHNTLTSDDIINQEVSDFMRIYDSYKTKFEKLRLLCEYGLSRDAIRIILGQIADSDEIKSYYTALGPDRLKALGYNVTKIKRELGIVVFSQDLLRQEIYSNFKEGDKKSLVYIKNLLSSIYSSVNYQSTPKATDLGNYFELKECLVPIIDVDGKKKRVRGYELLRSKRDLLEEKYVD